MPGYEGLYEVSDQANVKSLKRRGTRERLIVPGRHPDGHLMIKISKDDHPVTRTLGRVVAEAFLGPSPTLHARVRHRDGDRLNNRAANLYYARFDDTESERECGGCRETYPLTDEYFKKTNYIRKDGTASFLRQCRRCDSRKAVAHARSKTADGSARTCAKCKQLKVGLEFGNAVWCRVCMSAWSKEYRQRPDVKNQERLVKRDWYLRTKYGLTADQYHEILVSQEYCCAICGAPQGASNRDILCVDHNHVTGAIRELLCVACNFAVRNLGDDIDLANKVMTYIYKHVETFTERAERGES